MTEPATRLPVVGPREIDSSTFDAVDANDIARSASDAVLVARIRAGDADAFKAMFHAHCVELHAYVVALTQDADVADECVQDVMCQVWSLGPKWQIRESIRGYLFTAARNCVSNHLRRQRVIGRWAAAATTGAESTGMGRGPEATDAACRRNEMTGALHAALKRLPERRRLAVTLRCEYQLTNVQIAHIMGTSVKYVEREMMLGLRIIRRALRHFF